MKDADFSGAKAALAGALNVAGPILTALQQAEQVFGVLQNAEKHKKALAAEVEVLQKAIPDAKAAKEKAEAHIAAVKAEIAVAEADADARINAVLKEEQARVEAAKATAMQDIASVQALVAEAQLTASNTLSVAEKQHASRMAELAVAEQELTSAVAALEKKLASLKNSAAKFAAALTEG